MSLVRLLPALVVVLAVLAPLIISAGDGHAAAPKQFTDFPVTEVFNGKPAGFDNGTAPENWAAIRPIEKEIIAEEMAKGPNFAGHYYLAAVGCGSGCEAIFVIDLRDGRIYRYPEAATNEVVFQKDSRLIIFRENKTYDLPRVYLVFENGEFRTLE